jgi:adenylylsulfate kinase-like enzyme
MFDNKKGILFWITGLSGSGKTSIAKLLHKKIKDAYGPTLLISGDNIRSDFKLKGYDKNSREKIGLMYSRFFKRILNQKINVIFAGIVLIEKVRKYNRKNIQNYFEIYIKSNINFLKKNIKKVYKKKRFVVGLDIIPEFPKNPHIIVNNNFLNSKKEIAQLISKKILKKIPSYYLK